MDIAAKSTYEEDAILNIHAIHPRFQSGFIGMASAPPVVYEANHRRPPNQFAGTNSRIPWSKGDRFHFVAIAKEALEMS